MRLSHDVGILVTLRNVSNSYTSKDLTGVTGKFISRQFAFILGYNGEHYRGVEYSPSDPQRTVDNTLASAISKTFGISLTDKINFKVCSRTDSGVSAAVNVFTHKFPTILEGKIDQIRSHLPADLKLFDARVVPPNFNPRFNCCGRLYTYTAPSFVFSSNLVVDESYRISRERLTFVREIFGRFNGKHNFHNFTKKGCPRDIKNIKHIFLAECSDPYVVDGIEYIRFRLNGSGFLYRQIRRMIGLVVLVTRNLISDNYFNMVFNPTKNFLVSAPPIGLVLENVHFDTLNVDLGRMGRTYYNLEFRDIEDEIKQFKETAIMPEIHKRIFEDKIFQYWVISLNRYIGVLKDLSPRSDTWVRQVNEGCKKILDFSSLSCLSECYEKRKLEIVSLIKNDLITYKKHFEHVADDLGEFDAILSPSLINSVYRAIEIIRSVMKDDL